VLDLSFDDLIFWLGEAAYLRKGNG